MSFGTQLRWWFVDRFSQTPTGTRIQVSGERFTSVMGRLDARASVEVPDRLGNGQTRRIEFAFERPRAFFLDHVIEHVPELAQLQSVASRLKQSSETSAEAAAKLVEAIVGPGRLSRVLRGTDSSTLSDSAQGVPASSGESRGISLDTIFDRALLPVSPPPGSAKAGVDALIGAVLGPRIRRPPQGDASRRDFASQQITDAVLLTALDVLTHPDVSALEASWRGLKLVMGESPGHDQLMVELVDTHPDAWDRALRMPTATAERPDAIFVGPQLSDPLAIERLAVLGERAGVPVVIAVDEGLPFANLENTEDSEASDGWQQLRNHPAASWLCATMNPVVLVHEETHLGPRLLGGSPAFAVAALMAAAMDRTEGLRSIAGPGRAIVTPAAHDPEFPGGERRTIPTAYFAPIALQEAGARIGLVVLGSPIGSDRVLVSDTPMVSVTRASLIDRVRQAHASRTTFR